MSLRAVEGAEGLGLLVDGVEKGGDWGVGCLGVDEFLEIGGVDEGEVAADEEPVCVWAVGKGRGEPAEGAGAGFEVVDLWKSRVSGCFGVV